MQALTLLAHIAFSLETVVSSVPQSSIIEASIGRRLAQLAASVRVDRYPICVEKLRIVMTTARATEGEPQMSRRAQCLVNVLREMPIFIEDQELIVGNAASRPMGLEIDAEYGIWTQDEIDSLKDDGFSIASEDEAFLRDLYASHKPRTLVEAMGQIVGEDPRLWPFMQSGVLLPAWKSKIGGGGGGYAQSGLGLGPGFYLMGVDIPKVIKKGTKSLIAEAHAELAALRYVESNCVDKAIYLRAIIAVHEALIEYAARFARLAGTLADREINRTRRKELARIATTCAWVPANPARDFYEACQAFWFLFLLLNPSPTAAAGRFDQYMYPFLKNDKEHGRIDDEHALELLCCLRIKDMQLNRTSGKSNRKKNSGLAKWHNWTIGGVTADGRDATNELTYLLLEAAKRTQLPHHTLTLRVHENTPEQLMLKALEVVKTGIGLPAFVGDKSYLRYFTDQGVPIEEAREYILTGCLDANLPGKSRTCAIGMFIVPLVFEIFLHNGIDPNTHLRVGLETGNPVDFGSFLEFLAAFKIQLTYFMQLAAEKNNVELAVSRALFPDPFRSSLMVDGISAGKDVLDRSMPFENGAVLNPVGMINVIDSLAVIKTLVYEQRAVSMGELLSALASNWEGQDQLRTKCLFVPKFGNGDDYVDRIATDMYRFWAETTATFSTIFGGSHKPTAISITSHQPGGALTGATPDGRGAREILADGTLSPTQGADTHGPTRLLASAMKVDQDPFQATLLNMKLHPSAMKSRTDLMKITALIKTYFAQGGKHVQFNVVDRATLEAAQKHPERHQGLAVRVAGYSAFFVQLGKEMQDEIISRTEHHVC